MKRLRPTLLTLVFILSLTLVACAPAATPEPAVAAQPEATATTEPTAAPEPTIAPEPEPAPTDTPEAEPEPEYDNSVLDQFDPANFPETPVIDNEFMSMPPGKRWVLEGETIEGDQSVPRRIEFTVTDLTKMINGVNTVVGWILDYSDDELVEAEVAFYAQDNEGNVWFMGEYPEEYEAGEFVAAPAWIPGIEGALAGITMLADPQVGTGSYPQGLGPAVSWNDRGQVAALGQETCVPFGCFENVLIIEEFNLDEPDAFQQKFYAPGVGNVRVGWSGADASQESLEMTDLVQMDADGLAAARTAALALEASAYEKSPDVYGLTEPSKAP